MTEDGGDVILLGEYRVKRGKYCGHLYTKLVNAEQREITCGQCDAVLDPFDCLAKLAQHHTALLQERKQLDADIRARRATLDQLKTEERNTRARLKRLATP